MITNEEYVAAQLAISERDAAALNDLKDALAALDEDLQPAIEEIRAIRAAMPPLGTAPSNLRANFESTFSQVESYVQQLSYLKTSVEQLLAQQVPAV